MSGVLDANLIRLFDFYLWVMFAVSLWRRRKVYWDAIRLFFFTMKRKKLLGRVTQHRDAIITRDLLWPSLLMIGVMAAQMVCSRVIWPEAKITLGQELAVWWRAVLLVAAFVPMCALDVYFLVRIGRFDREETEKYLDQAERWLGWRSRVVRVATVGIVNPTRIVDTEMRKSLEELGKSARWSMWWGSAQTGLRTLFGLAVWGLWIIP